MATAAYKAYQKYKDRYEAFMSERKKLQKRRYDLTTPGRAVDRHHDSRSDRRHQQQAGASFRGANAQKLLGVDAIEFAKAKAFIHVYNIAGRCVVV